MDSKEIKEIVKGLGADICGISTTERFKNAPEGHKPSDIYPECESVIVFAKKVPNTLYLQILLFLTQE
jgi:epoxyqueuosine reductase